MNDQPTNDESPEEPPRRSWWLLPVVVAIAAALPISIHLLRSDPEQYAQFLERRAPTIELVEVPRGIGIAPVRLTLSVTDTGAGIDEVLIEAVQRGAAKELRRERLRGAQTAELSVDIGGEKSGFLEGTCELEIRAFDRSLWSNTSVKRVALRVDYRRPRLSVVSTQHNARLGGSQLIFYKAADEDLAYSGVRVDSLSYEGFPARGLDKDFDDPSLMVAIYGLDPTRASARSSIRAFAEDRVGNSVSTTFYNKVADRRGSRSVVSLNDESVRENYIALARRSRREAETLATRSGQQLPNLDGGSDSQRAAASYELVSRFVRQINDAEITRLLRGPRFEKLWDGAFDQPAAVAISRFGDTIAVELDGSVVGEMTSRGYEFKAREARQQVRAANSGIVIFVDNIGVYGRLIALDHGLGLVSLYGHLGDTIVSKGDAVSKGQAIGTAGRSGTARTLGWYYELRASGVAVDPAEWWDRGWYGAHVEGKILEVRRLLGLQALTPLL